MTEMSARDPDIHSKIPDLVEVGTNFLWRQVMIVHERLPKDPEVGRLRSYPDRLATERTNIHLDQTPGEDQPAKAT